MKRIVLSLFLALGAALQAWAGPAYPGPIPYTQPDGSVITVFLHGDENFHWVTLADGTLLERDSAGYYRPAAASFAGPTVSQAARIAQSRRITPPGVAGSSSKLGMGAQRYLCVLVEFSDLTFRVSDPQAQFTALLNEEGYSQYGGHGSFRDYYMDSSSGQFEPTFDVAGPVRLSGSYKKYGSNGSPNGYREGQGFFEALRLLDEQGFDFSPYDNDKNGDIDFIFFFYAGYSAAETANPDLIWPHQWNFNNYSEMYETRFDGLHPGLYACSAELKGAQGATMAGIGAVCHEFGHALGIPDFYDVDGSNNGTLAWSLGNYSVMCYGSYNGESCIPPSYNALERWLVGWQPFPEEITASGSYSLDPIRTNQSYSLPAITPDEYFLLDAHDGTGWDSALEPGLLIYHYDHSATRNYVGGLTPYAMWVRWVPNNYADHPCFYIKRAATYNQNCWPFPGARNVTSYTTEDWQGVKSYEFRNITYAGGKVSFDLTYHRNRVLNGTVRTRDVAALPIPGATVTASAEGVESVSATVGSDGHYSLEIPDEFPVRITVTAHCDPLEDDVDTFDFERGSINLHFTLSLSGTDLDGLSLLGYTHLTGIPARPSVGTVFTPEVAPALGKSVASVRWTFDERSASGPSFTVPRSGKTRLIADITFSDGTTEQIVAVLITQ